MGARTMTLRHATAISDTVAHSFARCRAAITDGSNRPMFSGNASAPPSRWLQRGWARDPHMSLNYGCTTA
jgi:hypothetical protein